MINRVNGTKRSERFCILTSVALLASIASSGCASSFLDVHRSENMTAEQHCRAADVHEAQAVHDDGLYDPDGMTIRPGDSYVSTWFFGEVDYNPTQQHRWDAQAQRLRSRAHREFAQELTPDYSDPCSGSGAPVDGPRS